MDVILIRGQPAKRKPKKIKSKKKKKGSSPLCIWLNC